MQQCWRFEDPFAHTHNRNEQPISSLMRFINELPPPPIPKKTPHWTQADKEEGYASADEVIQLEETFAIDPSSRRTWSRATRTQTPGEQTCFGAILLGLLASHFLCCDVKMILLWRKFFPSAVKRIWNFPSGNISAVTNTKKIPIAMISPLSSPWSQLTWPLRHLDHS